MKINKTITLTIGIILLWSCVLKKDQEQSRIKHVIVIGFDGLSPDGLQKAVTPTFDKIIKEGSYTFHARAVLPTSSSSNWASMIMGAGPEQHGITSNSWEKNNFTLPTITQSEDFIFPTIFSLVNQQIENAEIGAIYHWDGFGRLFEKNAVDYDMVGKTEDETALLASEYIDTKKPTFTFIHFDHIDHAGHEFGHGTKEYYESVEKADKLLEQVFKAIEKAGIENETLVIISSDHGGIGKGHGGETLNEIEIPFILWGKQIKKDFKIKNPVYQYDNAATAAFALGLKIPHAWIGKPAKMAFAGVDFSDDYLIREMMIAPYLLPAPVFNKQAGGLFDESATIEMKNLNDEGEIRYTTNGSTPSNESKLFANPIQVFENTLIKSAVFKDGKISSTISEGFYRVKTKSYKKPVNYEVYYLNNLTSIPNLENRISDAKGTCFEITSDEIKEEIKSNTVIKFSTNLHVEIDDNFTFFTRSDDGSKLYVDGNEIVDNDGDHGVREKDGSINLSKGNHLLEVIWFNGGGGSWLDVYFKNSTFPKQILPTTIFN